MHQKFQVTASSHTPNALSLALSMACALAVACASPPKPMPVATPVVATPEATTQPAVALNPQDTLADDEEYEPWTSTWPAERDAPRRKRHVTRHDAGVPFPGVPPEFRTEPKPAPPGWEPPRPDAGAPWHGAGRALTPMDQGQSTAELEITAAIRKQMVLSSDLSAAAKNTKVITVGDSVTLRGRVHAAGERTRIEEIARRTPGVRNVECLLEVQK